MKSRKSESHYRLVACESRWMNQIDRDLILGRSDDSSTARSDAVWVSCDRTSSLMEKYLKCSTAAVSVLVLVSGMFETELA